eukprot:550843_1
MNVTKVRIYVQFKENCNFILIKQFHVTHVIHKNNEDKRKTRIDYLLRILQIYKYDIENENDFYEKIGIKLNDDDISLIKKNNIIYEQGALNQIVLHRLINELNMETLMQLYQKHMQNSTNTKNVPFLSRLTDMSVINRFIFSAPKPSYNKYSFPDELLMIPPKEKLYKYYKQFKMEHANEKKQQYCDPNAIPCVYIERKYRLSEATHLLLYFHSDTEDLGKCYAKIDYIRMKLQVNILAPEYPGYGISVGDVSQDFVVEMVQNVYEFVISPYGLNIPPSRIIVYGENIGSAAALSLTSVELNRIYIPPTYTKQLCKKNYIDESSNDNNIYYNDTNKEQKYDNDDKSLQQNKVSRKYFLSTFLKQCPHSKHQHHTFFENDNKYFYEDEKSDHTNDPFERLPLASLFNILRKGNVQYPTSVNKNELLQIARTNDLIPPRMKANIIRKWSLLILVCPFSSFTQYVADKVGVVASYLVSDRFKNIEAIKKAHGALLIIHGKENGIIPYQHSIEIHKTAQKCDIQPTHIELLDGCDHNTMDLRKITNIINKFFKHQFNLCKSSKRLNNGNN